MSYEFPKKVNLKTHNFSAVFRSDAIQLKNVQRWFDNFRERNLSYIDNKCSGLPESVDDKVLKAKLAGNLLETTREITIVKNENQEMIKKLKLLVEDTYRHSGNQRVVILGHSLGSLYTIYFLKQMTISWKKQHIRAFLSVCGPLGGAVKAVSLETSGASLGSPRNPIYFRDMQRSFPSTAFLLPKPEIFGKEALVITPKRNYSAYDYEDFFRDMSMKYGPMMYNDTKDLVNGIETPEGIDELYCIHSYGLPTAKQLIFKSFPDGEPEIINGDGDYTVNIDSLKICKKWKNVNYITIKNADHMQIVSTAEFLLKLKQILYRQPNAYFPIIPPRLKSTYDFRTRIF